MAHTSSRTRRLQFAALAAAGLTLVSLVWWMVGRPSRIQTAKPDETASPAANPFLPEKTEDSGWPFIRGPRYDGRSPETLLADSWPDTGPPVLWTRPLGQGYSAFTAVGDRAFTQYQTLAGQFVICLDASTGETIWEYRYDWPYEAAGIYPGPRSTPTWSGGRIYFAGPSGLVGCLSEQGSLLWSINVVKEFDGQGNDFGYSCTPVVERGLVLLVVGGKGASLVALDARDGSTVWRSGDESASYTPVLPITIAGKRQVIGYLENSLVCADLMTGASVWKLDLSSGYDEHAAWPLYSEPHLWISSPFRAGSKSLTLSADGTPPRDAWQTKLLSNDVFSSVLHEGFIYGFDLKDVQAKAHRPSRGTFRCLDFATGEERWATEATGHTSVIVADSKLILFNDKGELILARAGLEKYEELSRVSVLAGEICWTPPALHRGRVFLRNEVQAACLYVGEPELLDRQSGPAPLTVADIPQTEYRDLARLLGVEPEYAFDIPTMKWFREWYVASIAILLAARLVALLITLVAGARFRSSRVRQIVFYVLVFLAGAAGTTLLSLWRNDFVYTWHLCLFVLYHVTVSQVRLGKSSLSRRDAWTSRGLALAFLAICVGYFLLCRRLSLVFEWAFLGGFPAAVPFSIIRVVLTRKARGGPVASFLLTLAEFSALYWSSVALLAWRYQLY
jgi:outer membrane protein assembly factor BamB